MPLIPTIDRPHQIQPKPPLDDLTVDELRHIYDLKTSYGKSHRDIICEHIDDAEDKMNECKDDSMTHIDYHKQWLDKLNKMLKDPRCVDPSAILHSIEIHQAEIDRYQKYYDEHYPKLRDEYVKQIASLQFYDKYEAWTAGEIWDYAARKFRKDVSKPYPHPGALQDPLYHGIVTDDLDDPYYEPNGG